MNIIVDGSLPGIDAAFPWPFKVTRYYSEDELVHLLHQQDILLCRSTLKVNSALLKNTHLKYVATASSGTDHINRQDLCLQHIQLIDAKGCNATSVADYVISCIAYLDPKNLMAGKKAGIIGMGRVGTKVSTRLIAAGFDLLAYDPLKANRENEFQSCDLEDLYQCDVLCVHAELHATTPHPSVNLIDDAFLSRLKPGCIIINAARGGIINEEALLSTPQELIYCTDVYLNEPAIDTRIVDKTTLCTPHIAGHSLEAKYAAVALVSEQLHRLEGLPVPQYATPELTKSFDVQIEGPWQEQILSLYNPLDETLQLKLALDKKDEFLKLRQNHNTRHDFSVYLNSLSQFLN